VLLLDKAERKAKIRYISRQQAQCAHDICVKSY